MHDILAQLAEFLFNLPANNASVVSWYCIQMCEIGTWPEPAISYLQHYHMGNQTAYLQRTLVVTTI